MLKLALAFRLWSGLQAIDTSKIGFGDIRIFEFNNQPL